MHAAVCIMSHNHPHFLLLILIFYYFMMKLCVLSSLQINRIARSDGLHTNMFSGSTSFTKCEFSLIGYETWFLFRELELTSVPG